MTSPAFARARSEEQRAERRGAILATASEMLVDGRVAELSLNELARRVGLAKSNVLRYFETREAVLLELLDREYTEWLDALEAELAAAGDASEGAGTAGTAGNAGNAEQLERLAVAVARTAAGRPVLSELLASAATVLEHNVSAEVAADYKRAAIAQAVRLVGIVESVVGAFPDASRIALAGAVNLAIGGAWGMCRPSPGMLAAYRAHPELEAMRLDYGVTVRELVATVLSGLRARPVSQDPLA